MKGSKSKQDSEKRSQNKEHVFLNQRKDEGCETPVAPQLSSVVTIPKDQGRKDSTNSIASSLAKGTTLLCFRMSDVAVSIFILLPLTIAMWRGIWDIMNHYTDPWVSIGIGNVISLSLYYFQENIKQAIPTKMNFFLFYPLTRILLLTHAFSSINQWRGFWNLLDNLAEEGNYKSESAILSTVIGAGLLILGKVFSNVLTIPLFVGVDEATSIHDCPLRFNTPVHLKFWYFFDCFYSVIIVQNLVVAAWRGIWTLADLHLYPENAEVSALVSLGIGTCVVVLLSILQPCYFRFMVRQKGIVRLIVFDVVTVWGFIGTVLSWRGTWELYNILLVFETPLLSEWLTVVVGTVGTILLGCLSTVATRGITVDGEDSGDGTAEWPISYISLLQKKRHHGIPFPEPWLFRYLCTSQRVQMTEPLTLRRRSTIGQIDEHQIRSFQGSKTKGEELPIGSINASVHDGPKETRAETKPLKNSHGSHENHVC